MACRGVLRLRLVVSIATCLAVASMLASVACDTPSPYRIGIVLDVGAVRAAQRAVREINAAGGIGGHPLELRDVGGASSIKARVAIETAEQLADDPSVLAVIGHTNSGASLAASQVYNERRVVQIAPTSTSPIYSDAGPYSFRMVASDVHQGVFLAEQALARGSSARIAVAFVNNDYGRPLREILVARLASAGRKLVYEAPFAEGEEFADGHVTKEIVSAAPDLLVWIGGSSAFVWIAGPVRKALPALTIVGSDAFPGSAMSKDSAGVFNGVQFVRLVDVQRPDPLLRAFLAAHVTAGAPPVSDQDVLTYDAVMLLAEAMRQRSPQRAAIREWLEGVGRSGPPQRGLSGPIVFEPNGDRTPQYHMHVITGPPSANPAARTP